MMIVVNNRLIVEIVVFTRGSRAHLVGVIFTDNVQNLLLRKKAKDKLRRKEGAARS